MRPNQRVPQGFNFYQIMKTTYKIAGLLVLLIAKSAAVCTCSGLTRIKYDPLMINDVTTYWPYWDSGQFVITPFNTADIVKIKTQYDCAAAQVPALWTNPNLQVAFTLTSSGQHKWKVKVEPYIYNTYCLIVLEWRAGTTPGKIHAASDVLWFELNGYFHVNVYNVDNSNGEISRAKQRLVYCNSLKIIPPALPAQPTGWTFTFPAATDQTYQLLVPTHNFDPLKVDCADSIPFCDFTSTTTYTLTLYWFSGSYQIPANFQSGTADGYLKFDQSTNVLTISRFEYTTLNYNEGGVDFSLRDSSGATSQPITIIYSDECNDALSWGTTPISDLNGSVVPGPSSYDIVIANTAAPPATLGVWKLNYNKHSHSACRLVKTFTVKSASGADLSSYYGFDSTTDRFWIKIPERAALQTASPAADYYDRTATVTVTIEYRQAQWPAAAKTITATLNIHEMLCKLVPPATLFKIGASSQTVLKQKVTSYDLELNDYTIQPTSTSCGTIFYQCSPQTANTGFDPWAVSKASMTGLNSMRFSSIADYTAGVILGKFEIGLSVQGVLETVDFSLTIIDCSGKTITWPNVAPNARSETYPSTTSFTFGYEAAFPTTDPLCTVEKYKVVIQDFNSMPNQKVVTNEKNASGVFVATVDATSTCALCAPFVVKDALEVATDSTLINPPVNFFGTYQIEVFAGVGSYMDTNNPLRLTFTLLSPCTQNAYLNIVSPLSLLQAPGVVSPVTAYAGWVQENKEFYIDAKYVPSPLSFTIQETSITYNESVCGDLLLSLTDFGDAPLLASPLTVAKWAIKMDPVSQHLNAMVFEHRHEVKLVLRHASQPDFKKTFSFTIVTLDCSVSFASTPLVINYSPQALNTQKIRVYGGPTEIPIGSNMPASCKLLGQTAQLTAGPTLTANTNFDSLDWISLTSYSEHKVDASAKGVTWMLAQQGKYTGEIARISTDQTTVMIKFSIVLCWIAEPDWTTVNKLKSVTLLPSSKTLTTPWIDVDATSTSLLIDIAEYGLTSQTECGTVVYDVLTSHSTTAPFDLKAQGNLVVSGNKLTFNNIKTYPIGELTVVIQVRQSILAETEFAYSFEFKVPIVACLSETINVGGAPYFSGTTQPFRFGTSFDTSFSFSETYTFPNAPSGTCAVSKYQIECHDSQVALPHSTLAAAGSYTVLEGAAVATTSASCTRLVNAEWKVLRDVTMRETWFSAQAGFDQVAFEGKYKFVGQPIHDSDKPFNSQVTFFVEVKLNCDLVQIELDPPTRTPFTITAPPPSNLGTFTSMTLQYWQRSSVNYKLNQQFKNPHPYSCTMSRQIYETTAGVPNVPTANQLSEIALTFDTSQNPDIVIRLSSTQNKRLAQMTRTIVIQATLDSSTSKRDITFQLEILHDCSNHLGEDVLVSPLEVIDRTLTIGISAVTLIPLTTPVFTSAFEDPGTRPCNITVALAHDTTPASPQFSITLPTSATYPLNLRFVSNNEVKIYSGSTVVCDLSSIDVDSCQISYKINVLGGDNKGGTHVAAVQSQGVIVLISECKSIGMVHVVQANFFRLSLANRNAVNPNMVAGYEVRDPPLRFDLPFVVPVLRSGDDIVGQCGPLVYTVDIISAFQSRDAFTVTMAPVKVENVTNSANVTVNTTLQEYALHSGVANGNYSTLYQFVIKASFSRHPEQIQFVLPTQSFWIRDFCAGMSLSGPPQLTPLDTTFNLTKGGATDLWTNKIDKFLMSETGSFLMAKMSYTKFRLDPINDVAVVNEGCGELLYLYTQISWNETWSGNDIMYRPLGSGYMTAEGTVHHLEATKRFQVGDHNVTLLVKSDTVPISTSQRIEFRIQIRDCFLKKFEVGEQAFKSLAVSKGDQANFAFANYTQTPNCGFLVDYKVTIIKTYFGAKELPQFDPESEGTGLMSSPQLVSLDVAGQTLRIQPEQGSLSGYTFAVYITGHVRVNATVQGPVSTHNNNFAVSVPTQTVILSNKAPMVQNKIQTLNVFGGEATTESVGVPYDQQNDEFVVAEWGFEGLPPDTVPDWISLKNESIATGIRFNLSPGLEAVGESYNLFFVLLDFNEQNPMSEKFTFSVNVISKEIVDTKNATYERQEVERKVERIRVSVEAPDSSAVFNVVFNRGIKLPTNSSQWTSANEGDKKLNISLVLTNETQTMLYDLDRKMYMSWKVKRINILQRLSSESHRRLSATGDQTKTGLLTQEELVGQEGLIIADKIEVQLNFTLPDLVSRLSLDRIAIDVQKEMFEEEIRGLPEHSILYLDQNREDFIFSRKVQPYVSSELVAQMQAITKGTENVLRSFFSANIAISFLSAGALQYLWGLINTLQMIVLTVLFQLDIPPNAEMVMEMILKMCSLEFVPTEEMLTAMFGFRETQPFDLKVDSEGNEYSKFADVGFDNSNFFLLLGAVFFVAVFYACLVALRKLTVLALRRCGDNRCTRYVRRRQNQAVVVTRFLLEGCIEIGMSAMISVLMMEKETFQNGWEVLAIISAFISLVLLLLTPIYFIWIRKPYLRAVEEAKGDRSVSDYSKLFEEYRANSFALLYPVFFFVRRYCMIIVLTTMPGLKYAQIFAQLYATIFVIQYIWKASPYYDPQLNRQELVNEAMVLLAAYPLLTFTTFLRDEERRWEIGWCVVAIIVLNIMFNITVLVVSVSRRTYKRTKFWCIRRNAIKKRKLALEAIEARAKAQQAENERVLRFFGDQSVQSDQLQVQAVVRRLNAPIVSNLKREDVKGRLLNAKMRQANSDSRVDQLLSISIVHSSVELDAEKYNDESHSVKSQESELVSIANMGKIPLRIVTYADQTKQIRNEQPEPLQLEPSIRQGGPSHPVVRFKEPMLEGLRVVSQNLLGEQDDSDIQRFIQLHEREVQADPDKEITDQQVAEFKEDYKAAQLQFLEMVKQQYAEEEQYMREKELKKD